MCSKGITKCILILFNSIFFLLGIAIAIVGVIALLDRSVITSVLARVPNGAETADQVLQYTSLLHQAAYILIAVGCLIFIIGFCGCFGAIKESKCFLYIYAIFVFLLLLLQVATVVLAFLYKDFVILNLRNFLNATITEKYEGLAITNGALTESIEPYSAAWDIAMISLECCGNYDYTDFAKYATRWNATYSYNGFTLTNAKVPISCCKVTDRTKLLEDLANFGSHFTNSTECLRNANPMYTNTVNCYDRILGLLNMYTVAAIAVGIVIVVIELIGIISACVLIRSVGKDD